MREYPNGSVRDKLAVQVSRVDGVCCRKARKEILDMILSDFSEAFDAI